MVERTEFRDEGMARQGRFRYLPEGDRYLLARERPRLRLTLIGAGLNGQEHIRVAQLEGRAAIHGVYDPNPSSVEAARELVARHAPDAPLQVFGSLMEACADPDTDGFIICTPNDTHLDVVREVARAGRPLLLEKPMATTVADAAAIVRLAAGHPAPFGVGLQYRYKPVYAEALHEARVRRSLGDIKLMTLAEHRMPFLDKVGQWNKFARRSGGTLVEKCCHYFDLFNLFAGARPVSVYADGAMAVNFRDFSYGGERSDILDAASVIVRYANGVLATFTLCMFAPMFAEELTLCGDAGRLRATEHEDFLAGSPARAEVEVTCGADRVSRTVTPRYPAYLEASGHNGGTFMEHVRFLDAIEGRATDAATAEEGFWSVVVGAAAEESVRTGAPVAIAELLERDGIAALT